MTVTKVGGANMIPHAQWPQCPPFPRVAVFYVTPAPYNFKLGSFCWFYLMKPAPLMSFRVKEEPI